MQIQTATVTTTQEVKGIFLTEGDITALSFPLYKLLLLAEEDATHEFASLSDTELQAVREIKVMVDNFRA